jgi:hypothetical protein
MKLRGVREHFEYAFAARQFVERALELHEAELAGARELVVAQQELEHVGAPDAGAHAQTVHLVTGQALQDAHPLHAFEGAQFGCFGGQQLRGTHVDDAAGHVGAFEIASPAG